MRDRRRTQALIRKSQYNLLQQPLYERRREIILGKAAPTEDEVKKGVAKAKEEDEEYEEAKVEGETGMFSISLRGCRSQCYRPRCHPILLAHCPPCTPGIRGYHHRA